MKSSYLMVSDFLLISVPHFLIFVLPETPIAGGIVGPIIRFMYVH